MFIIIPLGGKGERFKKEKYEKPKALIPIFEKPILYYLLDNLDLKMINLSSNDKSLEESLLTKTSFINS